MSARAVAVLLVTPFLFACGAAPPGDGPTNHGGDGGDGGDGGGGSGGGVSPPVCEDAFAACDGDATGSWTVLESCGRTIRPVDLAPFAGCLGVEVEWHGEAPAGTLTLESDGSFRGDLSRDATARFDVPAACLAAFEGATPAQACAEIGLRLGAMGEGSCEHVAAHCTCRVRIEDADRSAGLWSQDQGVLTLAAGGETRTFDFCSRGDRLLRRERGFTASPAWLLLRLE